MPKEHRVAGIASSAASSAVGALHDVADGAHNANPATGPNGGSDYACGGSRDEAGEAPGSTATAEYSTCPLNSQGTGAFRREEYSSAVTSPIHSAYSPPTRPSISQSRPSLSQSQRESFSTAMTAQESRISPPRPSLSQSQRESFSTAMTAQESRISPGGDNEMC